MTPDKRFTKDCSHLRHVSELWPQNETLMGQSLKQTLNLNFSFSGTELFVVRAYPRRLFNIQAVDGVSITLSFTLISVLYCNNRAIQYTASWSKMNTGTAEIVFHSISSQSRAHWHTPDTQSHFSSSLLKLKILVEAQQSRHCAPSDPEHRPFLSGCPNNGGN